MQSRKKRIQEFKDNPKMLRQWIRNGNIRYRDSEGGNKFYKDAFEALGYQLYCDNMTDFNCKTHGLFGNFNWKEFFENEYKINLDNI